MFFTNLADVSSGRSDLLISSFTWVAKFYLFTMRLSASIFSTSETFPFVLGDASKEVALKEKNLVGLESLKV